MNFIIFYLMVASRKYAAGLRPDPILSETPYGAIFCPVCVRLFALFPYGADSSDCNRKARHRRTFRLHRFTATVGTDYSFPLCRGFLFLQINGLSPPLVTACPSPSRCPRPCLFLSVAFLSACRTRAGRNLLSEAPSSRQAQSFGLCIYMRF